MRDPLEVQDLVCLELLLDQQKGGERKAEPDDGNQPDGAVLRDEQETGVFGRSLFSAHGVSWTLGAANGVLVILDQRRCEESYPRRVLAGHLGDFCRLTYHLACLFARLRRRANSDIVRLCACWRALKTNENPAQSGISISGNRLRIQSHIKRGMYESFRTSPRGTANSTLYVMPAEPRLPSRRPRRSWPCAWRSSRCA